MANTQTRNNGAAANLGFEAKLRAAADALRNNMDAAEYKHVVLGLIFLKYISDAFEAKRAELEAQAAEGEIRKAIIEAGLVGERRGREIIYRHPALLEVLSA
jgi:type I restriction-modification system DNA methylase subunit